MDNSNVQAFPATYRTEPVRLSALSSGIQFLSDFWAEHYLDEYIQEGGSKIKFITGRPGSGKSHFLRLFSQLAEERNYKTANFSARVLRTHCPAALRRSSGIWVMIQRIFRKA